MNNNVTLNSTTAGAVTNFNGSISGSALNAVTITGAGRVIFGGNNTGLLGAITVGSGATLEFIPGATAPTGNILANGSVINGAGLVLGFDAASSGAELLSANDSANRNYSLSPNLSLGATGGIYTYSGTMTPGANGYRFGGGGGTLIVSSNLTGANALTINAGSLTGTVSLTNATNDYSGVTTVNGGTLSFAANTLGNTSAVVVGNATLQWATGNTTDLSSRLTLVDGATAVLDTNGNPVSFAGAIGNNLGAVPSTGGLTKTGNGTLTLASAAVHTGTTTLANGGLTSTVSGTGVNPLGTGNVVITNGTLSFVPASTGDTSLSLASATGKSLAIGDATNGGGATIQLTQNGSSNLTVTAGPAGSVLGRPGKGSLIIAPTTALSATPTLGVSEIFKVTGESATTAGNIYSPFVVAQDNSGPGGVTIGSFVTYDTTAGFRALEATGSVTSYFPYSSGAANTFTAGQIADITAAAAFNTSTVGSIRVGGATMTVNTSQVITMGTGAVGIILNPTGTLSKITGGTLGTAATTEFDIYVGSGAGGGAIDNIAAIGGTIVKSGPGLLTYGSGSTTSLGVGFTGTIVINGGTFKLGSTGAEAAKFTNVIVNSGGTYIGGAGSNTVNQANFTINAGGTVNLLISGDTNGLFQGAGTLTASSGNNTWVAFNNTTFSGVLSGGFNNIFTQTVDGRVMTLAGTQPNTTTGSTTVNRATLVLAKSPNVDAIAGSLSITPATSVLATVRLAANNQINDASVVVVKGGATGGNAVLDLANYNETFASLSDGSGTLSTSFVTLGAGTLTLSTASGSTTFGGVISGAGGSLVKAGGSTQILSGANTYTGGTTVTGGTLRVSGSLAANTPLTVNGGATFSLASAGANPLSLSSLSLGTGSGTTTISLDLGSSTAGSYDQLTTTATATTANAIQFGLTSLAGFGTGTYHLLQAAGGLDGASSYAFDTTGLSNGFAFSTAVSATAVDFIVSSLASTTLYWTGSQNGAWNKLSAGSLNSNWSTDLAGTTDAHGNPGAATTVIFSSQAVSVGSPTTATTLEVPFSINHLEFNGETNSGAIAAVTIAPGAAGTLTVTPTTATDGINLKTGAPNVTISAPITLGGNQTWTVADSGKTLTVGAVTNGANTLTFSGAGNFAQTGIFGGGAGGITLGSGFSGTVTLSQANTYTGPTTITAGTLAASAAGALGTSSATAVNGTLNLTGGALTYTGLSTVTGAGTINVTLGTGSNTTTLNGDYSGFTGILNIGTSAAAGAGKVASNGADNASATINVLANGTIFVLGATKNASIVLNGGDTGESFGQLRLDTGANWAGAVTLAGAITGTGDFAVGANAGTATISGIIGEINGAQSLSKGGAGTLILTNANTYTGITSVGAGTLQVNTITGGLGDNSAANAVTLAGGTLSLRNNGTGNNGTVIFGSTSNTLGYKVTTTASSTLTVDDLTANTGNTVQLNTLTMGAQTLTLTNGNSYGLNFVGGLTSTGATAGITNNLSTTSAGLTLASVNATIAGADTITFSGTGNTVISGAISQNGTNALALTKSGTGSLTINGAATNTGIVTVSAGTLNLSSTGSLTGNGTTGAGTYIAYGSTAGTSVVNIAGNITNYYTAIGSTVAGANAVYNQTAGTVNYTSTKTDDTTGYVAGAAGYGYMNITGGTTSILGRYEVSEGGTGVAYIGGGTLNIKGDWAMIAYKNSNAVGEMTIGPNGLVDHSGAAAPFGIVLNQAGAYGILNIAGGTLTTTTQPVQVGNGAGATTITGFLNLAGGTLQTGKSVGNAVTTGGTNQNFYINLAGGTLKATAALVNALPSTVANITINTTLFGAIDNSAAIGNTSQNFTGGFTVDTNGNAVSLNNPLLAATASGVTAAGLNFTNSGAGYVGAPMVQFTGGTLAAGGTPAAGYALISGGVVTGIVITSPGTYTVAPTITLTGGGATTAAVVTVSSLTANTVAGLTKTGSGTLTLSGASTFAGGVNILNGTVSATSLNSVSGGTATSSMGAPTTVANGTITLGSGSNNVGLTYAGTGETSDRVLSFAGTTGTVTLDQSGTGLVKFTSAATFGGAGSKTLALQGSTAGTGELAFAIADNLAGTNLTSVSKAGTGTWTLSSANTYTGTTSVTAGTLALTVAGAINGSAITVTGGTITESVANALTGSTSLTINNAAVVVTLGDAQNYTGATTLTAGTLKLTNAGAIASSALSIGATGILQLRADASTLFNDASTAITASGATINVDQLTTAVANTSLSLGAVTMNGAYTLNTTGANNVSLALGAVTSNSTTAANIVFNNTIASTGTLTLASLAYTANTVAETVTFQGAGNTVVTGVIGQNGANTVAVTQNGAGSLTLKGANTYSGGTTLTTGTLNLANASALGSGALTIGGGTIDNTSGATLALTGNTVQNWNASFAFTGTNSLDLGAGSVALGATPTVTVNGGTLTVGGVISGVTRGVAKSGTGTLVLSGANTYTGVTTLNAGTLVISSLTNGGVASNIGQATNAAANLVLVGGKLQYTGGSVTTDRSATVSGAFGIEVTSSGATLEFNSNLVAATSNKTLTKTGNGTLTLSGAANNAFLGLDVQSGTVILSKASTGAISGVALISNISDGTTVQLAGTGGNQIANGIAGLNGLLDLNGRSEAITAFAGGSTGVLTNTAASTTAVLTISGGTNVYSGVIQNGASNTGVVSLVFNTGGTTTLSAANTYTGATSIAATVVTLGNANAMQNSSVTVSNTNGLAFASGISTFTIGALAGTSNIALTDSGAGAVTLQAGGNNASTSYSGVLSGTGSSLVKQGTGALTLSGANTFTGGITVSNGTLVGDGTNALGPDTGNVTVGALGTLNLGPTAGNTVTLNQLTLASGSTLTFNLGAAVDNLVLSTLALPSSGLNVNINILSGFTPTTGIVLLTVPTATDGGFLSTYTSNPFVLNNVSGGFEYTLNSSTSGLNSLLTLDVNTYSGSVYWKGGFDNNWGYLDLGGSPVSNWVKSDQTTVLLGIPGSANDVIFSATSPSNSVTTVVDASMTVKTLTVSDSAAATILGSGTNALTFAGTGNVLTLNNGSGGLVLGSATPSQALPLIVGGATQTFLNSSTGLLDIKNDVSAATGTPTLTLAGTGNGLIEGSVNKGTSTTLNLVKSGAGTWTISGLSATAANNYNGTTTLDGGTLAISGTVSLTGAMTFGATLGSTNLTTLNLTNGSLTLTGGLTVQTNSNSSNFITLGSGGLSVPGGLTVGYNSTFVGTVLSTLTVTGTGVLSVGGNVQIGQVGSTQGDNDTGTLDLSGLLGPGGVTPAFTANVTNFNVGQGAASSGLLILSPGGNSIAATTINVSVSGTSNSGSITSVITLAEGANVIKADTINMATGKNSGTITFLAPTAGTGTVTITNKAGNGAANLLFGAPTNNTGGQPFGLLDLRGHTANVTAGTVQLGISNTTGTGGGTGKIQFDAGTFTATTLTMGLKSSTGSAVSTGTIEVGGGAFSVNNGGSITLGQNSGSSIGVGKIFLTGGTFTTGTGVTIIVGTNTGSGTANGEINVSGGTFTVNGASLAMAANTSTGTATGLINLTGGTFISNANITKTGGTGTTTATLTLDGGTLDMTGHAIGGATAINNVNLRSGTLQNVSEINNGAALSKTTTGTLVLAGTNAYTGATNVSAGVLRIAHGSALGGTTNGTSVIAGAALEISNDITTTAEALTLNGSGVSSGGALRNFSGTNTYAGAITLASAARINSDSGRLNVDVASGSAISGNFDLTLGGAGRTNIKDAIDTGSSTVTKDGAGVVELSGANLYTGDTNVNQGELVVSGSLVGSVNLAAGAFLSSGGNGNVASTVGLLLAKSSVAGGGTVAPGGRNGTSGTATIGQLNATGNVTLGEVGASFVAAKLQIEVAGAADYDRLSVGAGKTVNLNNVDLSMTALDGYSFASPSYNDELHQFNHDGITYFVLTLGAGSTLTGNFNGTSGPTSNLPGYDTIQLGNQLFAINYHADFDSVNGFYSSTGNDVALMAIPEPNALAMLASSLGMALGLQRFRRRRA